MVDNMRYLSDTLMCLSRYFAYSFDTRTSCVSIARFGGDAASSTIPKQTAWPKQSSSDGKRKGNSNVRGAVEWRLSIEDPFELHDSVTPHDLGIVLTQASLHPPAPSKSPIVPN